MSEENKKSKHKTEVPRWDIGYSLEFIKRQPGLDKVLPILNAAEKISAKSFLKDDKKVNVSSNAIGNHKIISLNKYTEALKNIYYKGYKKSSDVTRVIIDNVVNDILSRHINADGRKLKLDDCLFYSISIGRGSPFGIIHSDTDWLQFPDADGFQFWFLLENSEETGNMFLVNTPLQGGNDMPEAFYFLRNGIVVKTHHTTEPVEAPINVFENIEACKFTFKYIDMKPGECLILSKRQLHMSDFRPALEKNFSDRLAIHMRVIIKKPDSGSITFWPNHPYAERYPMHKHLSKICDKNFQINVGRFSMVNFQEFNKD